MKQKNTVYLVALLVGLIFARNVHSQIKGEEKREGDQWRKKAFNWIYEKKHWAPEDGIPLSGPGSTLEATTTLRFLLPSIIKAVDAKSILDAGCGDFTWMQDTEINIQKYIGVDIARSVIETNRSKYSNEICSFFCKDVVVDILPKVDIILCRDCLAHLSNKDIFAAVKNFKKSGAKYLLTSTYPKVRVNMDIMTGNFRGMNLRAYPFNFPVPIMQFQEMSAEEDMQKWGKYIALWRLDDIEV
ncbi:methyltransferase domain-containing protein [Candidatus Dependentiae bacterium]